MRKIFIFSLLLALCLLPGVSGGQGTAVIPTNTQNSIVRVFGEDEMVVYNHTAAGVGQFLLVKQGQPAARVFDLPDAKMEVLDFEIMKDTVWFCGVRRDTSYPLDSAGMVGMFGIRGAFGGSGLVHYTVLPGWIIFNLYNTDEALYVRNLTRLDVFL